MKTNEDVYRAVAELCDLEKQTIIGAYEPFGAHATAIYEYLKEHGITGFGGQLTDFGQKVRDEILRDPYYSKWVDKPCDSE